MNFLNLHPFFVHVPLVLIPTAAILVLLGRKFRQDGFDTATLLITVGAAVGALVALSTGFGAEDTVPHDGALGELMEKHELNAKVVTALTTVAAVLAVGEWRGWFAKSLWWARAAILTFAAIGTVFTGHMGATMVYLHGAGVVPVAGQAK